MWAETIAWEVLNFAVLAAVCSIWRPSATSKLLCEVKQLSMNDDDGVETGIEMAEDDAEHKEGDGEESAVMWGK